MKKSALFAAAAMVAGLCACTQKPVEVVNKGSVFYGRGVYAQAPVQDSFIADKYQSNVQSYSTPAHVASVEVREVEQPVGNVTTVNELPPLTVAAAKPAEVVKPVQSVQSVQTPVPAEVATASPASARPVITTPLKPRASEFIWPVEGRIISRFGPKQNGKLNEGINIEARGGEPVWAAASGEVIYTGNDLSSFGNVVIVRHSGGWMTAYAHLANIAVHKGQQLNQGSVVGYVGSSGSAEKPQLHFGIRQGTKPVDPEMLLPQHMAALKQ